MLNTDKDVASGGKTLYVTRSEGRRWRWGGGVDADKACQRRKMM